MPAGQVLAPYSQRLGASAIDASVFLLTVGLGWLVWSAYSWTRGQTPGMQLLGLRVVDKQSFRIASWSRMLGREALVLVVAVVSIFTLGIPLLLYLVMFGNKDRKQLWDYAAGDVVTRAGTGAQKEAESWWAGEGSGKPSVASPQRETNPAPGWYADPIDSSRRRWWDGTKWAEKAVVPPVPREPSRQPVELATPRDIALLGEDQVLVMWVDIRNESAGDIATSKTPEDRLRGLILYINSGEKALQRAVELVSVVQAHDSSLSNDDQAKGEGTGWLYNALDVIPQDVTGPDNFGDQIRSLVGSLPPDVVGRIKDEATEKMQRSFAALAGIGDEMFDVIMAEDDPMPSDALDPMPSLAPDLPGFGGDRCLTGLLEANNHGAERLRTATSDEDKLVAILVIEATNRQMSERMKELVPSDESAFDDGRVRLFVDAFLQKSRDRFALIGEERKLSDSLGDEEVHKAVGRSEEIIQSHAGSRAGDGPDKQKSDALEPLDSDCKECPDCAEQVKSAARKCRYCGYRFEAPS